MKTQETKKTLISHTGTGLQLKFRLRLLLMAMVMVMFTSISAFAHCDSYDGPVIKDALKALDQNNVELVLKWIEPQQEKEITSLFDKTYKLKSGDKEVYAIVEKHFLETLVRLHRETEGEPYTGLKPAGSMTPLVAMADNSIAKKNVDGIIKTVNEHLDEVLRTRYSKVAELSKTKDDSAKQGREYVAAYVQYTHTLEALEHILQEMPSHGGEPKDAH